MTDKPHSWADLDDDLGSERQNRAEHKTTTDANGRDREPPLERLQIGSDVEIARRVIEDFGKQFGEVVFCDGNFWRYVNRTHWQPIDESSTYGAVAKYDGAIYKSPAGKACRALLSNVRIKSVITIASKALLRPDFFREAPVGINCRSGFIAFDKKGSPKLLDHHRDHRCRHVLPGSWLPGAVSKVPPPGSMLHQLLFGVFLGDADSNYKRAVLAETAGSAALGYATKLRQPKAVILKGETADNGKSQILDLIRGLLPASAVATVTATKMGDERFIVGLAGKLLNAADELSNSAAIASDAFKAAVTGEPISGRDVYHSAVTFRSTAQHLFATNNLPTFVGGMDRGVQRRLLVVIFNRVIPDAEKIEHIGTRIGEEEPDLLLAWAVGGAGRLISNRGFTTPPSSKIALQNWLYGADPVLAWVRARVDPAEPSKPGERLNDGVKSGYAHAQFREWALNAGYRADTIPAVNGFVQRLQACKDVPSIVGRHTRSGNWLTGLRILLADRDPDEDDEIGANGG